MTTTVELQRDGEIYRAELAEPGGAKLLSKDGAWCGDVFWIGRELVVANGAASDDPAHNNPIKRIDGHLSVVTGDAGAVETIFNQAVSIPDAAGVYIALSTPSRARVDERDAWLIDWHRSHGPEEPNFEGWWLKRQQEWGPSPDNKDPGETGSSRMVRGRAGVIHRILQDDELDPALAVDAQRWIADQWKRQVHYYDWSKPGRFSGCPLWWIAEDDKDARVGHGYRAPGGFSGTYSGKKFYGRVDEDGQPWEDKSVPYPCDHMHFELQKVAWIALLFKSSFATWHAVASIEGNHSRLMPTTYSQARSFGWVSEAYSIWQKILLTYYPEDGARLVRYTDQLLDRQEAANVHCPETDITLPCVSDTKYGKTGHMEQTPALEGSLGLMYPDGVLFHRVTGLENILKHGEYQQEFGTWEGSPHLEDWRVTIENRQLTRGWCVWMGGIQAQGLDKIIEFGTPEQAARARMQLHIVATLMQRCADPSVWIDQDTLEPSTPYYGVLADISAFGLCYPAKTNPAGTSSSFLLPGLEVLARHYPSTTEFAALADKIIDAMAASGYWGSSSHPDDGRQNVTHLQGWESSSRRSIG